MKKTTILTILLVFCLCLCACTGGGGATYSSATSTYKSSTQSTEPGGPGLCKYKVGDKYVCTKKATNGNFCKEHYDYLNDIYNSFTGK